MIDLTGLWDTLAIIHDLMRSSLHQDSPLRPVVARRLRAETIDPQTVALNASFMVIVTSLLGELIPQTDMPERVEEPLTLQTGDDIVAYATGLLAATMLLMHLGGVVHVEWLNQTLAHLDARQRQQIQLTCEIAQDAARIVVSVADATQHEDNPTNV